MAQVTVLCTVCSGRNFPVGTCPLKLCPTSWAMACLPYSSRRNAVTLPHVTAKIPRTAWSKALSHCVLKIPMPKSRHTKHRKHNDHININKRVENGEESLLGWRSPLCSILVPRAPHGWVLGHPSTPLNCVWECIWVFFVLVSSCVFQRKAFGTLVRPQMCTWSKKRLK